MGVITVNLPKGSDTVGDKRLVIKNEQDELVSTKIRETYMVNHTLISMERRVR